VTRPGFEGDLIPDVTDQQTIGDSVQRWLDLRVATIVADTVTASLVGNVTGNLTGNVTGSVSGAATGVVTLAAASRTLTIADSGAVLVAVVDGAYTLPAAAAAPGMIVTIMTGVASAGTGVRITRAGSDVINGKTTSAGTTAITSATTYTNSGASDVVWDYVTLISDGVLGWYSIGQSGTWA
jgi:hypothetical protein